MTKPKILIQLDSDAHASVFDAVVATDAGVDQLLQYDKVAVNDVRSLIHGAMFTRGPQDLHGTAVFVGGSDVGKGEALLDEVCNCFFGPMRVSVLLDANGANTTAAAAVLAASRHHALADTRATVLAATGPVGQRIVRLLASSGAMVNVSSRKIERAEAVCETIGERVPGAKLTPFAATDERSLAESLQESQLVFSAGAYGIQLLPETVWNNCDDLRVAIDLNAVPPLGIEGVELTDRAETRNGVACYGAIGVGGLKMKIHKAAVRALFERNDQVIDAEEVFAIGQQLIESEDEK